MLNYMNDERKFDLCRILASNLPTLRTKAEMSQTELAERLGLSRVTISGIESKRRMMQWSTFLAAVLYFSRDTEIERLMSVMGILDDDVRQILNIPEV